MKRYGCLFFVFLFICVGNVFSQNTTYEVGGVGPGGGLVFAVEGPFVYEVSRILGEGTWAQAVNIAKNYRGGDFTDWYLPSRTELSLVYSSIVEGKQIPLGSVPFWTSSEAGMGTFGGGKQEPVAYWINFGKDSHFGNGYAMERRKTDVAAVRAIRMSTIRK